MPNPVVHFEVIGSDARKLQEFYGGVFKWKIDADNPMQYGMVGAEKDGIAGGVGSGPDPNHRHVTFYIEVANLDDTLKDIEKSGGRTIMEPSDVPGGPRMAMFADPEGNQVGLIQAGSMQGSQN